MKQGQQRARRIVLGAALAAILSIALVTGAQAVHWPNFGGDAGRSGYQPVQEISGPFGLRYALTDPAQDDVRTSVLTTTGGGSAADALTIFGTQEGVLFQRALRTGAARGPEDGVVVTSGTADPDVFGTGNGSVTPVETSNATAQGQTYVVHNDDREDGDDITIAQFDQVSGLRVQEFEVPDTEGFTINSSPVISPPVDLPPGLNAGDDPDTDLDDRYLYFVASDEADPTPVIGGPATPTLFLVRIRDANTTSSEVDQTFTQAPAGLNPAASPTLLVAFRASEEPDEELSVTVSTSNGLRTYGGEDLLESTAFPNSGPLGGVPQTPSVPVTPSGRIPGENQTTDMVDQAPFVYVAVQTGTAGAPTTTVHKLQQEDGTGDFVEAPNSPSPALPGAPAPALAVTQEAESGGPSAGRVVVTTSANAYSLDTENLAAADPPRFAPGSQTGTAGFSRTTAAASGELAFLTRDDGEQLVLEADTLDRVPAGDFTEAPDNTDSTAAFGQPSLSRGFVQFAGSEGLFVFRSQPRLAVSDASVLEGDAGTRPLTFTVSLSRPSDETVTVDFATADRTATAGADYTDRTGTLTFSPGVTTQNVAVDVIGDTAFEPDETFALELSDASGATATDPEGTGTIIDDDRDAPPPAGPRIAIDDVSVLEGDSGTTPARFNLTLSEASAQTVTVRFATANDTATAPADYTATTQTVTFAAGTTAQTVDVPVVGGPRSSPTSASTRTSRCR